MSRTTRLHLSVRQETPLGRLEFQIRSPITQTHWEQKQQNLDVGVILKNFVVWNLEKKNDGFDDINQEIIFQVVIIFF